VHDTWKIKHSEINSTFLNNLTWTDAVGQLTSSGYIQFMAHIEDEFVHWGAEDPGDPISIWSRTGFVNCITKCPVTRVSKLQTETALSNMMAECIALSMVTRDLIPLK
jgi:hypothetical protein